MSQAGMRQEPKGYRNVSRAPPQPEPVHPAAIWQKIQKYPLPCHQTLLCYITLLYKKLLVLWCIIWRKSDNNLIFSSQVRNSRKKKKAALINIFLLTIDQIAGCNFKVLLRMTNWWRIVTRLCSSPQRHNQFFSSSFRFYGRRPRCFIWFTIARLPDTAGSCFELRPSCPTPDSSQAKLSTRRRNIDEPSTAKETDISLKSWWRPNHSWAECGFWKRHSSETNANVALICWMDV